MPLPDSPLVDLLVVLGTQRFGTDWGNVATAVKAALGPLENAPSEPPSATECEERFRALVEGNPAELSALAARLQSKRLEQLADSRAKIVEQIKALCEKVPAGHPARPAAVFGGDGDGAGGGTSGGNRGANRGGRTSGAAESKPENQLDEQWADIAEEEEKNSRRATVAGTLNKMLQAVAKHKWAYPFKRPVTDKEAPDYKDIITNPMDFMTLKKRIETGVVTDVPDLVADLTLIFDNAMTYNGKGTDYYQMAETLKEIVQTQQTLYTKWRQEHGGQLGAKSAAPAGAARFPGADQRPVRCNASGERRSATAPRSDAGTTLPKRMDREAGTRRRLGTGKGRKVLHMKMIFKCIGTEPTAGACISARRAQPRRAHEQAQQPGHHAEGSDAAGPDQHQPAQALP